MDRDGHYHPHLVHDVCPVPADHSWGGGGEPPLHPAELRRGEGRQGGGREDDIGSRHMGGGRRDDDFGSRFQVVAILA